MSRGEDPYYASHLPVLSAIADVYRGGGSGETRYGTVVECGVGLYSTPVLYALGGCPDDAASYRGHESNPAWLASVRALYREDDSHRFYPTDWESFTFGPCLVCFIDATAESRRPCLTQAMDRATVIILHDADEYDDHFYQCREVFMRSEWWVEFKPEPIEAGRLMPSTALVIPRDDAQSRYWKRALREWVDQWDSAGLIIGGVYR